MGFLFSLFPLASAASVFPFHRICNARDSSRCAHNEIERLIPCSLRTWQFPSPIPCRAKQAYPPVKPLFRRPSPKTTSRMIQSVQGCQTTTSLSEHNKPAPSRKTSAYESRVVESESGLFPGRLPGAGAQRFLAFVYIAQSPSHSSPGILRPEMADVHRSGPLLACPAEILGVLRSRRTPDQAALAQIRDCQVLLTRIAGCSCRRAASWFDHVVDLHC